MHALSASLKNSLVHVLLPRGCLPLQFAVARKPTLAISIEHIFHWNRNRSYTREWRDEHSTQLDHCDGKILHWYITCCANLRPTIWWCKHYLLPFPLIAGEDDYFACFPARNGILFPWTPMHYNLGKPFFQMLAHCYLVHCLANTTCCPLKKSMMPDISSCNQLES